MQGSESDSSGGSNSTSGSSSGSSSSCTGGSSSSTSSSCSSSGGGGCAGGVEDAAGGGHATDSSMDDDNLTCDTSASSQSEEETEDSPRTSRNKPLPRHKPQLLAPEPPLQQLLVHKQQQLSEPESPADTWSATTLRADEDKAAADALLTLDAANIPTTQNNNSHAKRDTALTIKSNSSLLSLNKKVSREHISKSDEISKDATKNVTASSDRSACTKQGKRSGASVKRTENKRDLDREFDRLLTHSNDDTTTSCLPDISGKLDTHNSLAKQTLSQNINANSKDIHKSEVEDLPLLIGRGRRKFKPLLPYKINEDPVVSTSASTHNGKHSSTHNAKMPSHRGPALSKHNNDPSIERGNVLNESRSHLLENGDPLPHAKYIKTENRQPETITGEHYSTCEGSKASEAANENITGRIVTAVNSSGSSMGSLAGSRPPTIADLVKVRERRKSFEKDTSSGSEWEKRRPREKRRVGDRCKTRTKDRTFSRKLSNSSLDSSSSSYLSESIASDKELSDVSNDSITQDDDAEPGSNATDILLTSSPIHGNSLVCSTFPASSLPPPLLEQVSLHSKDKLPPPRDSTAYSNTPVNATHGRYSASRILSEPLHKMNLSSELKLKESRRCRRATCASVSCCSSSDSDSSLSDEVPVDLDTEQSQTFSVSENNFDQVRCPFRDVAS